MKVGKHQLCTLIMLGSPAMAMVVPGRSEAGLIKRGLLRQDQHGGCRIAPDGLRALADAMEAGLVDDAMNAMRKETAERKRRMAEKTNNRENAAK